MAQNFYCTLCEKSYNHQKVPRVLPKCGHSFCQQCIIDLLKKNDDNNILICPEDQIQMKGNNMNIDLFPKNEDLIQFIDEIGLKKSSRELKNESSIFQKILERTNEIQYQQQSQQIINIINETTKNIQNKNLVAIYKSLSFSDYTNSNFQQYCQIHNNKNLDVICINQLEKICTTCALFGDHRNHQFVSLIQIKKKIKQRYKKIDSMIKKLKQLKQQMLGKKSLEQLKILIKDKKQNIENQINSYFQILIVEIQQKKQSVLKQLQSSIDGIQQKLIYNINQHMKNFDFDDWQHQASSQMRIFTQNNNIIQQIKYLKWIQQIQEFDIIQQGESILNQINYQKEIFENHRKNILNNIKIQFKTDALQNLDDCCKIFMQSEIHNNEQLNQIQRLSQYNEEFLLDSPKKIHKQKYDKITSQIQFYNKYDTKFLMSQLISKEECFLENNKNQLCKSLVNKKIKPKLKDKPIKNKEKVTFIQKKTLTFKKYLKIKNSEKYEKIMQDMALDKLEILDLSNAELGDQIILEIIELISKKVKKVKLIRNKLTDEGVKKLFPYFENITSLNLSQNYLTDKTIDLIKDNIKWLPQLKSTTLSQNLIKERNIKNQLDEIKKYKLIISL